MGKTSGKMEGKYEVHDEEGHKIRDIGEIIALNGYGYKKRKPIESENKSGLVFLHD